MKPTGSPNEKDNRNRYADQPKQKAATHDFLLLFKSARKLKFQEHLKPAIVRFPTNRQGDQKAQRNCPEVPVTAPYRDVRAQSETENEDRR
jgi:hypothetical protein